MTFPQITRLNLLNWFLSSPEIFGLLLLHASHRFGLAWPVRAA